MTPIDQKVYEHFLEHMDSPLRLTPAGELHPDEARMIAARLVHFAAQSGYMLRPDRRIVVELDLGRRMLSVTAQSTETCERFDLCDPTVWQIVN